MMPWLKGKPGLSSSNGVRLGIQLVAGVLKALYYLGFGAIGVLCLLLAFGFNSHVISEQHGLLSVLFGFGSTIVFTATLMCLFRQALDGLLPMLIRDEVNQSLVDGTLTVDEFTAHTAAEIKPFDDDIRYFLLDVGDGRTLCLPSQYFEEDDNIYYYGIPRRTLRFYRNRINPYPQYYGFEMDGEPLSKLTRLPPGDWAAWPYHRMIHDGALIHTPLEQLIAAWQAI